MNEALLVEPITNDILTLTACMVIDALVFPRPSVQFHQELTRSYARIWVVRPGPHVPPFGFLASHQVGESLHVVGVATDPTLRRRGGARAMLAAAVSHATRHRLARITLEVHAKNEPAISLYESVGFTPVRTLLHYYGRGEHALGMMLAIGRKPRAALPPRRAG